MRTLLLALACTFTLACAGSKPKPAPAPPAPLAAAPLGSLAKAHASGDFWFTGQPKAEDLALLPALGVRTVVNLRPAKEQVDFDERTAVEGLGLTYANVPFGSPAELADSHFDEVRRLLGASRGPLLLHCASANRVGAVWIPFRVLDQGVELEAAVAEAKEIGLKSPELEAKARDYVARHAPK